MRLRAVILLPILLCSACSHYSRLQIIDRVYAPLSGMDSSGHWRRSYKIKYLAPAGKSGNSVVIRKATDLMKNGHYREAVAILSRITPENNDAGRIYNNLGIGYEVLGEREKALAYYTAACRISPNNPYYRMNLNSL